MNPDAATTWIVDRVGQQMIYIDRQTRHHHQVAGQPGFSIENHGKDKWNQAVKSKVENCLASSKDSALDYPGGWLNVRFRSDCDRVSRAQRQEQTQSSG